MFRFYAQLHFLHGLLKVGDNVVDVFDADGKTDEVWSYTCFEELLFAELAVCVTRWMEYACACVCHVCYDADEVETVHELDGFFA